MTTAATIFLAINGLALLLVPRRWTPLPLLVGTLYMTRGQAVNVDVFTFTILRILVAIGLLRTVIRRELLVGGVCRLDWWMGAWGAWTIASVLFHEDPATQIVLRLRYVFDGWGLYLIFRAACRSWDDVACLARILTVVLVPIAAAMLVEKVTGANHFSVFGGVPAAAVVRNGIVRAQGPFAHSILAGTVGAGTLPFVLGTWTRARWSAAVGGVACLSMVFASGSSGPILAAVAGLAVMSAYPLRRWVGAMKWGVILMYVAMDLVMNRPAYYVMTRMDVTGGSTGWHRARLIQSAFQHLEEWWLFGTDHTRNWMPTGVPWSSQHTDITSHYLAMGVDGGVLLMALFVAILVVGFSNVGRALKAERQPRDLLVAWSTGAALCVHALTCVYVSYFDNSILFLYLTLGATTAGLFNEPATARHRARGHVGDVEARIPAALRRSAWAPPRQDHPLTTRGHAPALVRSSRGAIAEPRR